VKCACSSVVVGRLSMGSAWRRRGKGAHAADRRPKREPHAHARTVCPAKRNARSCGLKFQTITLPSSDPEISCFRLELNATEVTASLWPRKERSSVGSSGWVAGGGGGELSVQWRGARKRRATDGVRAWRVSHPQRAVPADIELDCSRKAHLRQESCGRGCRGRCIDGSHFARVGWTVLGTCDTFIGHILRFHVDTRPCACSPCDLALDCFAAARSTTCSA
jgi:hypothetical protein